MSGLTSVVPSGGFVETTVGPDRESAYTRPSWQQNKTITINDRKNIAKKTEGQFWDALPFIILFLIFPQLNSICVLGKTLGEG